jgi:hypothetical protein
VDGADVLPWLVRQRGGLRIPGLSAPAIHDEAPALRALVGDHLDREILEPDDFRTDRAGYRQFLQ